MKYFCAIWALTLYHFAAFAAMSEQPSPQTLNKLDAYYESVLKDWELPGMAIGIVKDGELIFARGYGVLEVGKPERPDENTLFAIASNTKAVTAALIARMTEEGLLGWDDKVRHHLPYFELYDHYVTNETTIRDLLSHRVGLGTFSGDVIWYKSTLTGEQILRNARHLPKAFDFRYGYGYSNLMYLAAGLVTEQITGKSWTENVTHYILNPLGMSRTVANPVHLEKLGNYATPHALFNGVNTPIAWENWEEIGPMGGLISSVSDVSRWMIFMMNHGIHGQDTLISRYNINLMWTPHNNHMTDHTRRQNFNRHFNAYGLGWGLSDYHGRLSVGHTGGYDGMISEVRMIPDEKLGVVVLTNGIKSPIGAITNYTLETMLGIEARDWAAEALPGANRRQQEDPRITAIKNARVPGTRPTLNKDVCAGTYHAAIYGHIMVKIQGDGFRLEFEHSPDLSASLKHWHHDVWEIVWDQPHAFFGFGTVQFLGNNKQEVSGMAFEVPNRDIFFEELKPVKIQ